MIDNTYTTSSGQTFKHDGMTAISYCPACKASGFTQDCSHGIIASAIRAEYRERR